MTKKELLKSLEQFPDDYEVVLRFDSGEEGITFATHVVEGIGFDEDEQSEYKGIIIVGEY